MNESPNLSIGSARSNRSIVSAGCRGVREKRRRSIASVPWAILVQLIQAMFSQCNNGAQYYFFLFRGSLYDFSPRSIYSRPMNDDWPLIRDCKSNLQRIRRHAYVIYAVHFAKESVASRYVAKKGLIQKLIYQPDIRRSPQSRIRINLQFTHVTITHTYQW